MYAHVLYPQVISTFNKSGSQDQSEENQFRKKPTMWNDDSQHRRSKKTWPAYYIYNIVMQWIEKATAVGTPFRASDKADPAVKETASDKADRLNA